MSVSGKFLTVKIGATPTILTGAFRWTVREAAEKLDRTTGSDNGFGNADAGVIDADGQIEFFLDTTLGGYNVVAAGTILTSLKLYRNGTDLSPAYTFPTALILESEQGAEVRGRFQVNVRFTNQGSYTAADPPGA